MRPSLFAVVGACGLLGCASFPQAHLLQGQASLEVVQGPVVCGPVGFRQVPLQSRWGEYVRVTVAGPWALRGNVLVHANGVAQEAREWNTEVSGALIVEARFPNESVERNFALERERPIDITLTGLEALGGGSCEGAVFTVEHGVLVPSIDERAWVAELERRGGPELAARREAARVEADARRQAHYAQWEARQQVVASVEVREAHYAQWEARHAAALPLPAGERVGVRADAASVVAVRVDAASVAAVRVDASAVDVSTQLEWKAWEPSASALTPTLSPAGRGRELIAVNSSEEWSQPFERVPVTTESQVATTVPPPPPACGPCAAAAEPESPALVPAMFQLLFNVAAFASQAPPPPPVHAARPAR